MSKPLVIFDCDGVLVDSETIASEVFAAHLQQIGLDYTPQRCRQTFTGLSLASCARLIAHQHDQHLPEHFFARMQQETFARFAAELQPVDGIIDVLAQLDARQWPYCVASSGAHEKIRFTLGHTGLLARFEGRIYSASDVAHGKPAPDLFLHAAAQQGHPARHCVVIEDAAPGIAAARAAGMAALLYGVPDSATQATPDAAFLDMAELPTLIERHRHKPTP